jgi:uncharacterized protein YdeI (BOF family)
MKQLLILAAAFTLSTGALAQEKMDMKMNKTAPKGKMEQHSKMKMNCVMMKDGTMNMIKNGKTMKMDKDKTLKNGTKVKMNGTVKMKNGKTMQMKDGDMMDMDGKMGTMEDMDKMDKME